MAISKYRPSHTQDKNVYALRVLKERYWRKNKIERAILTQGDVWLIKVLFNGKIKQCRF